MKTLAGIFAPIGTPFREDEDVDLGALESNMGVYARSGILGYLALGSNGENKSLTEDEKLVVLRTIVAGRAPDQVVIAGATYEAQRDTERFFAAAAEIGADFGLLLSPSYFRKQMTDDVLFRYYTTTADRSPLPLLVYNAPGFSGVTMSVGLVARLAQHPNIVGMKDSASSGIEAFLALESPAFHVLAGSANFLFPAMMAGSIGGTVSLANSFPAIANELYRLGAARDAAAGPAFQERCRRLNEAISGTFGVPGVKAATTLAGLRGGLPRRPLLPLTPEQVAALREALVAEGALDG
ncbi:MAG: Dihydrodipicolinate synthase [Acidobacteria bacterium]|nr:Dihydrodipicolinate synthase [Acidobacteriota bacterium]